MGERKKKTKAKPDGHFFIKMATSPKRIPFAQNGKPKPSNQVENAFTKTRYKLDKTRFNQVKPRKVR